MVQGLGTDGNQLPIQSPGLMGDWLEDTTTTNVWLVQGGGETLSRPKPTNLDPHEPI